MIYSRCCTILGPIKSDP